MLKPWARLATARPIRPMPKMPRVFPLTWVPSISCNPNFTRQPLSIGTVLSRPPAGAQKQHKCQISGRICEDLWCVGHEHAMGLRSVDIDVVVADAVRGDDFDFLRQ